jgi:uncharacterized SAM-binding protein YcdF (DUF218 family)
MDQETVIILKDLLLPPGGFILLLLISLLFIRGVFGKLLLTLTLVMFYLCSTPFVASNLMAGLEQHIFITPEEISASQAGAIVVLGGDVYEEGPEYGGDTIKGAMLERVRYAAWLQKRTGLPIVASGGSSLSKPISEAKLASQVLTEEFGCKVLATEDSSKSTWENAELTSTILKEHGISKIVLVTHSWHMPRAVRVFERNGFDVVPAPTIFSRGKLNTSTSELRDWLPSSVALNNSRQAMHEYVGIAWYRIKLLIGI